MSSTTTGRPAQQQPWPSRREREGVHRVRSAAPRHARPEHADPDPTERLPVVVPQQRAPEPRVASRPLPADVPAPRPAEIRLVATGAGVPAQRPARFRPVAAGPCPPRPAVGSGVGGHRVDGRIRTPRNGLGLAAVLLGLAGLPFALVPVTAFVASGLGVLAVAFGVAGWSRTRSGTATNTGSAVTGAVLGLIALGLGVVGTVAFFQNPDRLVYDVDALTGTTSQAAVSPIGE